MPVVNNDSTVEANQELRRLRAEVAELRAEAQEYRTLHAEAVAERSAERLDAAIEVWSDALHMAVGHDNPEDFVREYMENRIADLKRQRKELK